jgi:hypothetical protein
MGIVVEQDTVAFAKNWKDTVEERFSRYKPLRQWPRGKPPSFYDFTDAPFDPTLALNTTPATMRT